MNPPPLLTIHTDGASRGNPGAAAFAYVIARDGEASIEEAGCLGSLTNNQAEYEALVRALHHALHLGERHSLNVHSDSELMVKQMNGEYRVKNEDLLPLYEEARKLVKRFEGIVTFVHVRRGMNKRADALCNEALDGKRVTTRSDPALARQTVKTLSAREEVVGYLREAVLLWAGGDDGPTPEQMWERLRQLLAAHGLNVPS